MNKIHLLSDLLVNQIAAGEVVQRPASVVKELLDNAIDADSKNIKIVIKEAGKQLIQVMDDGLGMSEIDACMCFTKHATSKITTADDLNNIHTMGFRGEAMASIAAISQVVLETRLPEDSVGFSITIEGSEIIKKEAVATSPGTKVSVRNLFYNVPARRNFLKSNAVEFKHIVEEVQRAALARPDIGFILYHNATAIYRLSPEKISHRIIHLLGDHYKQQLIPCKETTDMVTIEGYIGKPEHAKKTRGEQFLFINERFVKSAFLNHAIKSGYDRLVPIDSFYFYVLYFTINPRLIDINVHPTKTEVKFQNEKSLYAILQAVVKRSLAIHHVGDSIDFEQDINFPVLQLTDSIAITPHCREQESKYAQMKPVHAAACSVLPNNWQDLFADTDITRGALPVQAVDPLHYTNESGQAVQLYASYIITQIQSGSLLIDQQAAHERILYDKFIHYFQNQNGASQQLLIPEHIALNPADYMVLIDNTNILETLGFKIGPFGESTIVIYGWPAELSHHVPKKLLEGLIEQLKWHNSNLVLPTAERFIRALAKKASVSHGTKLNNIEMDKLLAQLFASSNTMYTPDGRKISTILSQDIIRGLFKITHSI